MTMRLPLAAITAAVDELEEGRVALRALVVDLVAFVDREHEVPSGGRNPKPGDECFEDCAACRLLARVPSDVLAEARRMLAERES